MYSFAFGAAPLIFSGIMFIMGFIVLAAITINNKKIKKEKIKAGNVVAIIGGIVGILSVILYFALPKIFCFWRIETTTPGNIITAPTSYYGGIGFVFDPIISQFFTFTSDIFLILTGVFIIAGIANKKVIGITGGFVLLIGPLLLLITLVFQFGTLGRIFESLPPGQNVLLGTVYIVPNRSIWIVWIGWFMAIGGGVAGLIGGALCD